MSSFLAVEATEHAAMVWSPSYGAGYPFGASARAVDPSGQVEVEVNEPAATKSPVVGITLILSAAAPRTFKRQLA